MKKGEKILGLLMIALSIFGLAMFWSAADENTGVTAVRISPLLIALAAVAGLAMCGGLTRPGAAVSLLARGGIGLGAGVGDRYAAVGKCTRHELELRDAADADAHAVVHGAGLHGRCRRPKTGALTQRVACSAAGCCFALRCRAHPMPCATACMPRSAPLRERTARQRCFA